MVLIRQTNGHNQMTCTDIELRNNHTSDVKLLKSHFSTLFYFCLVLTVLSILQLIGSSCSSVFKLNLSPKNPFGSELVVKCQHKTRDTDLIVALLGISFLVSIETIDAVVLEVCHYFTIPSEAELAISQCVWLCSTSCAEYSRHYHYTKYFFHLYKIKSAVKSAAKVQGFWLLTYT